MLQGTYSRQREKTSDKVWRAAKKKAQKEHDHLTGEDFTSTVISEIHSSEISVSKDYVPVEFDYQRDEVYFSQEKVPRIGNSNGCVWFITDSDDMLVEHRLSVILDEEFDMNLGLVSSEGDEESTRYEIEIPFSSEEERESRIREKTVKNAREMRIYRDVDEEDVIGDCPNDGCDGEQYQDGMGSCGPKYKCTRFGCTFKFVRDVL